MIQRSSALVCALKQWLSFGEVIERPHRHLQIASPEVANILHIAGESWLKQYRTGINLEVRRNDPSLRIDLKAGKIFNPLERYIVLQFLNLDVVTQTGYVGIYGLVKITQIRW